MNSETRLAELAIQHWKQHPAIRLRFLNVCDFYEFLLMFHRVEPQLYPLAAVASTTIH